MYFLMILCIAGMSYILIRSLYKHIRYIIKAHRFGILRTIVKIPRIFISLGIICIMIAGDWYLFSLNSTLKKNIEYWTNVQSMLSVPGYEEQFAEKYNKEHALSSGTEVTDVNRLCQNKLAEGYNYVSYLKFFIVYLLLITIETIVCIIDDFFFITESGFIVMGLDEPSEITAQRSGNKLNIYFKDIPDQTKPHIILKLTPKNLAAVGRFIEYEESEQNIDLDPDLSHN